MDEDICDDVENAILLYEKASGRPATRTRQMIDRQGEIKALSNLVVSPDLQSGFQVLRDNGKLDQTFEAIVVRYSHLFSADVVEAAKWRLDNPRDLL